jgi:hypothetical protein
MQFITGQLRNQTYFTTLEDRVSADNFNSHLILKL